ncbi:MAG: DUF4178 domain-containing protein [Bdellovibrionia bacterium]
MAGENPVQKLECPGCGASLKITAVGQSLSVVCSACFTVADISTPGVAKVYQAQKKMKFEPLIPIGRRGKIMGDTYEMIGFMVRNDASGMYVWEEYLLFNPFKGFRWLVQFGGHWNYVVPLKTKPKEDGDEAHHLGRFYRKFLSGTAKVRFVLGEFYWLVRAGDEVMVADFIHPPEILSKEADKSEEVWSLGQYIEPSVVAQAFNVEKSLPEKIGVAPNQPSEWIAEYKPIRNTAWIAAGAMLLIQILTVISSGNTWVYGQEFGSTNLGSKNYTYGQPIVTEPFDITGRTNNLSIGLTSPVNNQWIEVQGDLVNDSTGESTEFESGVEFWSGYDDGHWSDGSQKAELILSDVPPGKYHLVIETSNSLNTIFPFKLELRRGVTRWGNFFWCLFYLSIFPIFAFWRYHRFEYKRWAEADVSPYGWIDTTGEAVAAGFSEDD